jgi:hypothetical protein
LIFSMWIRPSCSASTLLACLAEARRADNEHRLPAECRLDYGQLPVAEPFQSKEAQDSSEVAARLRYCAMPIEP